MFRIGLFINVTGKVTLVISVMNVAVIKTDCDLKCLNTTWNSVQWIVSVIKFKP